LESATATASGPDLFALGNAARFTGKPGLAVKAYQAVRQRFSNTEEASGAAFFLGRLSESSDPTRAMGWYERYVAEAPKGAWVADALGRHLVLLNGTQGAASAQGAAKNYLGRFPNGPYAGFARTILGP
jgi:TolA-binding protein